MNALVYVDIDQGIHKVKFKVALNEKQKKLHRFLFEKSMAWDGLELEKTGSTQP